MALGTDVLGSQQIATLTSTHYLVEGSASSRMKEGQEMSHMRVYAIKGGRELIFSRAKNPKRTEFCGVHLLELHRNEDIMKSV